MFNAFHIAYKNEKPYTDFPDLIALYVLTGLGSKEGVAAKLRRDISHLVTVQIHLCKCISHDAIN